MNFKVTLKTNVISGYLLLRIILGFVFLTSGLQKFLFYEAAGPGQFMELGFRFPEFTAWFLGATELICGSFILVGLATRLSTVPLIIITGIACIWKLGLLQHGFWVFAQSVQLDLSMLLLLIFVLVNGADERSVDKRWLKRRRLRA